MNSQQLVELMKEHLPSEHLQWRFDRKTDKIRLEHTILKKGMDISLPEILAKYETKKEAAINEVVYTIRETFKAMEKEQTEGFIKENGIYPVIRSTSFPQDVQSRRSLHRQRSYGGNKNLLCIGLGNDISSHR